MMTAASPPKVEEKQEEEMLVRMQDATNTTAINGGGAIIIQGELENHRGSQIKPSTATMIDADKLSYEIFSILESKFLFGYDDLPPPELYHFQQPSSPPMPLPFYTQRGKVCILAVDGGAAMRGLISAKALAFLENSLQTKSGNPDARLADFFDIAAGTGVGGLFSAMLFTSSSSDDDNNSRRPLYRADEISQFLADKAPSLFPRRRRRSPFIACVGGGGDGGGGTIAAATCAAERAFKNAFGESLTLRDAMKPLLIPCYDLVTAAPLVFSRADAVESSGYDFRLWEVVRATWAEPGRFQPAEMTSIDGTLTCVGIDGGVAMSNPAAAAVTHVLHNKHEFPFVRGVEDVLLLSIGCGAGGSSTALAGEGSRRGLRRQWSSAGEWARPVARIASDGAAELVDHAVALAFGHSRESNYVRIQANTSTMGKCGPNADYDPSPENVKLLHSVAEDILKHKNVESVMLGGKRIAEQTNMEKLDWFAGELVREHQRRSCRIAPTVAFKQPPPKGK